MRVIRALADGEIKTVKAVCDVEQVPHQYAYKILKKLERAGLVQGHRGPTGGYRAAKGLEEFTLYDVIAAVDHELLIFDCLQPHHSCPRNHPGQPCAVHKEFCRLQEAMEAGLRQKTMAEVLTEPK